MSSVAHRNPQSVKDTIEIDSGVDVAVELVLNDNQPDVSPEESRRLRIKCDWHLFPILCAVYTVQYMDKLSLSASYVLGLVEDNKLTANQFNTVGSAFPIGFFVFQYPQNWALQRYPVSKWLAFNIFLWSVFLGLHAICRSFTSLCTFSGTFLVVPKDNDKISQSFSDFC